jgi:hypothetical protein
VHSYTFEVKLDPTEADYQRPRVVDKDEVDSFSVSHRAVPVPQVGTVLVHSVSRPELLGSDFLPLTRARRLSSSVFPSCSPDYTTVKSAPKRPKSS